MQPLPLASSKTLSSLRRKPHTQKLSITPPSSSPPPLPPPPFSGKHYSALCLHRVAISGYFKEIESSNMSLTLVLASVPPPTRNEGLDKSPPDSAILIWLHARTYQVCVMQLFSVHGSSRQPHLYPPTLEPSSLDSELPVPPPGPP